MSDSWAAVVPRLLEAAPSEVPYAMALRAVDQAGFWEMFGHHNYGDPWRELRYSGD